jgi:hypothetical protein
LLTLRVLNAKRNNKTERKWPGSIPPQDFATTDCGPDDQLADSGRIGRLSKSPMATVVARGEWTSPVGIRRF